MLLSSAMQSQWNPSLSVFDDPLAPFSLSHLLHRRRVGRAYTLAHEIYRHLEPGTKLIDVGCGGGHLAYHVQAITGCHVTGVRSVTKISRLRDLSHPVRRCQIVAARTD